MNLVDELLSIGFYSNGSYNFNLSKDRKKQFLETLFKFEDDGHLHRTIVNHTVFPFSFTGNLDSYLERKVFLSDITKNQLKFAELASFKYLRKLEDIVRGKRDAFRWAQQNFIDLEAVEYALKDLSYGRNTKAFVPEYKQMLLDLKDLKDGAEIKGFK